MSSRKNTARLAGLLYLVFSLCGFFSLMYVPSVVFVTGDAAATAGNIVAHETLYRAGIVGNLIGSVGFIFVALALYELLKEVNKTQAFLMVTLIVVSLPISLLNEVNHLAALKLLSGAGYLSAFQKPQLDAMVMLFLGLWGQGIVIAQIFWGLWLFPLGILVYKSRFLPWVLGVFLFIAGFGNVAASLNSLLQPHYVHAIASVTEILAAGELPIIFWLLIMGAKEQQAGQVAKS
jgi:hypothetical protein